eukprot:4397130-Amphidinium_carterae.1
MERGLLALHLEPETARLWALVKGDFLLAWDLVRLRTIGRWRVNWNLQAGTFQAAAFCGDSSQGFVAVGRSDILGPLLMRAGKPGRLEELVGSVPETVE